MAFCTSCGAAAKDEAKFCGACGTQLSTAATASAAPVVVATPLESQIEVLAEFYIELGGDFEEFVSSYDLGFPLATAYVQGGIAEHGLTEKGQEWITETFVALLQLYGLAADQEVSSVEDLQELGDPYS